MDLADLVDLLRVEEDPLGHGRLAGVDMRDDPDVPRSRERNLSCHGVLTLPGLPLEMAEGAVRLGHLVRVFTSLDRRAEAVHGIDELGGELLAHALPVALARGLDEPAHAERQAAVAPDLDRDLVGRATDAAGLDLDDRRGVAHRGLEDLETRTPGLGLGPG